MKSEPAVIRDRFIRRYDIDWLRFLAMCAVFLFHCARFFDDGGWHVKNTQASFGMTVFVAVLAQWIMPFFFVLSGITTYYSIGAKKHGTIYLRERFKRLIIPLVFGIFSMIPLQVYFERVSHLQFVGTIFDFYPHYFDGFYGFGGNFAWMGLHLWYLLFLFVFSLLTLPLFAYLRNSTGRRLVEGLTDFLVKPGTVFLLFIPVAVLDFVLLPNTPMGIREMGGWNLFTYLLLFIYGYILAGDIRCKEIIQAQRRIALGFSIVTVIILFWFMVYAGRDQPGYSLNHLLFTVGRSLNSWCFLVALLGYGSKYLAFNHSLLRYINHLILPFYILHQTIILAIGFYVVQWEAGITPKYLVISVSSLMVILALYQFLIQRVKVLRFLFGIR